jgi:hypothetical protein
MIPLCFLTILSDIGSNITQAKISTIVFESRLLKQPMDFLVIVIKSIVKKTMKRQCLNIPVLSNVEPRKMIPAEMHKSQS